MSLGLGVWGESALRDKHSVKLSLNQHPADNESPRAARRQTTQDSHTSATVQGGGAARLLRSSQCLTLPVRDGAALETTSLLLGWLVQALICVTALAQTSCTSTRAEQHPRRAVLERQTRPVRQAGRTSCADERASWLVGSEMRVTRSLLPATARMHSCVTLASFVCGRHRENRSRLDVDLRYA